GIGGAIIEAANARERDRAGAHRTGLERDIEVAIDEPLRAKRRTRRPDGDHLGMRGRIVVGERAVAGARDNRAIMDDDAADRDFAAAAGRARFFQRQIHERSHQSPCAGPAPALCRPSAPLYTSARKATQGPGRPAIVGLWNQEIKALWPTSISMATR